jgi:alkanesulfonate monooxygenase SsuD/methylene tetrahydromethanopterin reductase-like flavin-dependent oxidoreductase (luciferase family)
VLLAPPIDFIEGYWTPQEQAIVEHKLQYAFVGSAETLRSELAALVAQTGADELMTTVRIYESDACLHSLEVLAEVLK